MTTSHQCDDCHHTFALCDIIRMEAPWGTAHRCEDCDEAFWAAQEGEWDGEPTTRTEYWDTYAD